MNTPASVALKYGVFTALTLIGYFLILKIMGFHTNPWLRMFNGPIVAYAIYASIKHFKHVNNADFSYTNGFKTGMLTGILATFIFAIFMSIYLFHLDVAFKNALLENWFTDVKFGGGILIFIILIEGLSSTTVLTLTFMQLLKKTGNIPQKQ
jgi:hypothetical protein